MGFKWIGAILIVLSCSGCGFAIAAGKRKEVKLLCQLIGILQFMESELQYHVTPLPELCRMTAGQTKGLLQTVFLNLYRELSCQKLPDARSCMYAAVQRSGEIPVSVRRLLIQLGNSLGQFDLSGQLHSIDLVRKRCEEAFEANQQHGAERRLCYQTLGVCAGAALAIILI